MPYKIRVWYTSGLTGSSMPTTQMQVRSDNMSFSLSQSGSGLLLKSRKATQIVLSPSQAIGSITFFTISSRSRGLKIRGSPAALRILEHLFYFRKWKRKKRFDSVFAWLLKSISLYQLISFNTLLFWWHVLNFYCTFLD